MTTQWAQHNLTSVFILFMSMSSLSFPPHLMLTNNINYVVIITKCNKYNTSSESVRIVALTLLFQYK